MKTRLDFWALLVCGGLVISGCCEKLETPSDPGNEKLPAAQPEDPTEKPLTDRSILNIQIDDDIMATVGTNSWNSIAYGSGKYVAVGLDEIAYSSNGTSWTRRTLNITSGGSIHIIRYLNGQFIARARVGSSSSFRWLQSEDGLNWNYSTGPSGGDAVMDIAYGDGLYVAACIDTGTIPSPILAMSVDGSSWTNRATSGLGSRTLNGVAFGNGKFVLVRDSDDATYGSLGYSSKSAENPDRLGEISYVPCEREIYERVVFGNNKFVAISREKSAVSSNGVDWDFFDFPNDVILEHDIEDMTFSNGFFVGISEDEIICSSDGINWTKVPSGTTTTLNCVCIIQ